MNLKEAVLLPFTDNCSQMLVLETRSGTACDWVRRKAERKCCEGGGWLYRFFHVLFSAFR